MTKRIRSKYNNSKKYFEDKITEECNNLRELLISKNTLICIRIEDKLNRLKQIILNGEKDMKTDERLIDTITDLAGYAILSKIYIDGIKNSIK